METSPAPASNDTLISDNKLGTTVSIGFIILGIIVSIVLFPILPKSQRIHGILTGFSAFLMLAAFSPQLIENYISKNKATDSMTPEFLIITALGVILKIPSFRKNLSMALSTKKDVEMNYIIIISIFMPLVAHIIWQWQCAAYNSNEGDALKRKQIFEISAPIFTVLIALLFIWVITVKPAK
jgi:hypothetical protein